MLSTICKPLCIATLLAACIAIAWPTVSAAAPERPTRGHLALASVDGATVQLLELPNPLTGELETSLGIFVFDPLTGSLLSGSTVLTPEEVVFDDKNATVAAGVSIELASFDPCTGEGSFQIFEVTEDLVWHGYGKVEPTTIHISGPGLFLFSKQRSRVALVSGVLEGDVTFDLSNAMDSQIGTIMERFRM